MKVMQARHDLAQRTIEELVCALQSSGKVHASSQLRAVDAADGRQEIEPPIGKAAPGAPGLHPGAPTRD